jgi:hypothetical protein
MQKNAKGKKRAVPPASKEMDIVMITITIVDVAGIWVIAVETAELTLTTNSLQLRLNTTSVIRQLGVSV